MWLFAFFFFAQTFQGEIGEKGQKVSMMFTHNKAENSMNLFYFLASEIRELRFFKRRNGGETLCGLVGFVCLGRARHRAQRTRRPGWSPRTEGEVSLLPHAEKVKKKNKKKKQAAA